jgi:hypothetical protein
MTTDPQPKRKLEDIFNDGAPKPKRDPKSKKRKIHLNFDCVTTTEAQQIAVKQIQADIVLLNELGQSLEGTMVPCRVAIGKVAPAKVSITYEDLELAFSGRVLLKFGTNAPADYYALNQLEQLVPFMTPENQTRILEGIHKDLQEQFILVGRFNESIKAWNDNIVNYAGEGTTRTFPLIGKNLPALNQKLLRPTAAAVNIGIWANWIDTATTVLKHWMRL